MAYRTHPAAASSSNGIESYYESRARTLLGLTAKNMFFAMHVFGVRGITGFGAVTGTGTGGGLQWLRFNATGNDVSRASFSAGTSSMIQTGVGKKWYIASYFRLTSATCENGTHGGVCVGTGSTAETVVVGVRGATSTTNFLAWSAAATIDSGQAIDTNRHVHELYRDGSTAHYLIDEVSKGSGGVVPSAEATCAIAAAAALGVNRSIEFGWVAVAGERE